MGKKKLKYIVRLMQEKDIKGVAAVEAESFPFPWPESIFTDELTNPLAIYLVLEYQDEVIGYAGFWLVLGEAQVTNIALLQNFRGKGLGRMLVQSLIDKAKNDGAETIFLEVRRSNILAQELYKKLGFVMLGVREGYYQDSGEDAFTMQKDLEKDG